jgi:hypothetical protein
MHAEAHTDLGKAEIEKVDTLWYDLKSLEDGISDLALPENCHWRESVFVADVDTPEFAKSITNSKNALDASPIIEENSVAAEVACQESMMYRSLSQVRCRLLVSGLLIQNV